MSKIALYILCSFITLPVFAQRATDTFKLYFDINIPELSSGMEKKIDLLIYNDKIIAGSSVMIVGYADYLGTEGHNKDLSMKRAENVKKYLVKYGLNADDITLCFGKGQIERDGMTDKAGFPTDRRVDIVVNNKVRKYAPPPPKPMVAPPKIKTEPRPHVDTPARPVRVTITDMSQVSTLRSGSTFVLKNVYFPADRHTIKQESYEILEKLFDVLNENPNLKISIEGHVCCIKEADDALDIETNEPFLSVNRAKEIYHYLVVKGIDPSRLKYTGFGRNKPMVADEKTDEDREKNRRVEIRIIENK